MTKATYKRIVSLTEEDNTRVDRLQRSGVKIVDIFRAGIIIKEKELKRGGE